MEISTARVRHARSRLSPPMAPPRAQGGPPSTEKRTEPSRPSPAPVNELQNRCAWVFGVFHAEQFVGSEPDHFGPFGIGKNIKLLLPYCIEDHVSEFSRSHACVDGG